MQLQSFGQRLAQGAKSAYKSYQKAFDASQNTPRGQRAIKNIQKGWTM